METLEKIETTISEKEVLRLLRYKEARGKLRGEIQEMLEDEIQEGYRLIKPKAIYDEVRVKEIHEKSIHLDNNLVLNTGEATRVWKEAEYLAVSLCTIGSALEERVSALFTQREYALAVILDSVGSVAVESVANHVNHLICERASQLGLGVSPRLSPGYRKWDLTDQRILFDILPGERIGVHLNESYMMIPRKSVSFCVGMGEALSSEVTTTPCHHCDTEACCYRRE